MHAEPTVFVVDENQATGEAVRRLAAMMNLRCEVFASGLDFLEFLKTFDHAQWGCVVTELKVPGVNGLQLLEALATHGVMLPVIFVSGCGTLPIAVRAMRAGAFHFLEKPLHDQELWDVLEEAVTSDREHRDAARHAAALRERLATLTLKEEQVLRKIADGKANRAIAKELDVSIRTIELRRKALMQKLGVESPDDLLGLAISACKVHALDGGRPCALSRGAPGRWPNGNGRRAGPGVMLRDRW